MQTITVTRNWWLRRQTIEIRCTKDGYISKRDYGRLGDFLNCRFTDALDMVREEEEPAIHNEGNLPETTDTEVSKMV